MTQLDNTKPDYDKNKAKEEVARLLGSSKELIFMLPSGKRYYTPSQALKRQLCGSIAEPLPDFLDKDADDWTGPLIARLASVCDEQGYYLAIYSKREMGIFTVAVTGVANFRVCEISNKINTTLALTLQELEKEEKP